MWQKLTAIMQLAHSILINPARDAQEDPMLLLMLLYMTQQTQRSVSIVQNQQQMQTMTLDAAQGMQTLPGQGRRHSS